MEWCLGLETKLRKLLTAIVKLPGKVDRADEGVSPQQSRQPVSSPPDADVGAEPIEPSQWQAGLAGVPRHGGLTPCRTSSRRLPFRFTASYVAIQIPTPRLLQRTVVERRHRCRNSHRQLRMQVIKGASNPLTRYT